MLEIEMKFAVSDLSPFRDRLEKEGATFLETFDETDEYFNAPDRDFAKTDEALRIRRIGNKNCITYKGPKIDLATKTRAEIEVPFVDGEAPACDLAALLKKLGYRPSGIVRKQRSIYEVKRRGFNIEVCLDDVRGLGSFVELEIRAPENQLEVGREALLESASALGLTTPERRSYLQMLLSRSA